VADQFRSHLMISEIRTVAADDLWLSTAYRSDRIGMHFSWKPDPEPLNRLLPIIEEALAPFEPRPHWGKLFLTPARDLEPRYGRLPEFRRLAERLDPRDAFRNPFLQRHVLG
jgi:xylitol oxidase